MADELPVVSAVDVLVPRKALRGMRSLVAGVALGTGVLGFGAALMVVDRQERCHASNEFRREDLPAAFELHDHHLGTALGANEVQIAEYEARFQADLAELLPARDCSLFP